MTDLRHALRSLARSPGFTAVAVLTLALCIGANSAIFSVINAVLLKPYPWPGSDRLVYAYNTYSKLGLTNAGVSIPDYLDRRAGVPSFEESTLITGFSANLSAEGAPERVYGLSATPSLFSLLQTAPALGRAFTDAEAEPGAARTVVLNDTFWRNRFGADPNILGREIRLNGESYTVIGVMPPGFYFPSLRAQFWVPFTFTPQQKTDAERGREFSTMLACLKPGATVAQAQRDIDAVTRALFERLPDLRTSSESTGFGGAVRDYLEQNVQDVRPMLWLLQAAVAAALLIGCANVANLLLARASARERDLAIRAALGASRFRLMRQLLTESVLLFLLGGALGLVVALWGVGAMNSLGVGDLPRGFGVALDLPVFAFTMLCALLTGVGFGALPAFTATRGDTAGALKEAGTRATSGRRHLHLRGILVVTEIALSLMLLATAGLFLKSLNRLLEVSPGFRTENVLTASLSLPTAKYDTPGKQAAFHDAFLARLTALPGVLAAGFTSNLPFSGSNNQGSYAIDGYTPPPGQPSPHGMIRQVSPGYFTALGIPVLRGRLFTEQDNASSPRVVVIDRLLAERYWPNEDPIGRRLSRGGNATQGNGLWTIVGVVAPVKNRNLEEPVTKETLYFPYSQSPNRSVHLVVKTAADPAALTAQVRAALLAVDPDQPLFDVKTMELRLDESLQRRRAPMILVGLFSAVAVLLAALGVYGVLAFAVGQRTGEIGLRMALGATREDILRLVFRQGAPLVLYGIGLGLAGYFALGHVLQKLLYGVGSNDPATLIAAPLLLIAIALLAGFLPARRALKISPMTALRTE